ncbi:MAG TPA: SCO2322 family protein [Nocardioides sp.]
MRTIRSVFISMFAMALATIAIGLTPGTAHAADIYRYWAYFNVTDDKFVAASTGPSQATPADGSIEGYRFAAPADFTKPNLPRADLSKVTFESVCGDTEAKAGEKRVAVLIDYGVEQDASGGEAPPAPEALCSVVEEKANGLQVLQKVAPDVRVETGSFGPMLCGIGGYPATGCADEKADKGTPVDGEPVDFNTGSDTAAGDSEKDDDSNTPVLIGVGVVIVLLGAGGVLMSRRRSGA